MNFYSATLFAGRRAACRPDLLAFGKDGDVQCGQEQLAQAWFRRWIARIHNGALIIHASGRGKNKSGTTRLSQSFKSSYLL